MENVFKNTYFGKPYKTRDGRKAIFVINMGKRYGHPYRLVVDDKDNFFNYDEYGRMATVEMDSDIISEWHEEINEEKLDKALIGTFEDGYIKGAYDYIDKACDLVSELVENILCVLERNSDYKFNHQELKIKASLDMRKAMEEQ